MAVVFQCRSFSTFVGSIVAQWGPQIEAMALSINLSSMSAVDSQHSLFPFSFYSTSEGKKRNGISKEKRLRPLYLPIFRFANVANGNRCDCPPKG